MSLILQYKTLKSLNIPDLSRKFQSAKWRSTFFRLLEIVNKTSMLRPKYLFKTFHKQKPWVWVSWYDTLSYFRPVKTPGLAQRIKLSVLAVYIKHYRSNQSKNAFYRKHKPTTVWRKCLSVYATCLRFPDNLVTEPRKWLDDYN